MKNFILIFLFLFTGNPLFSQQLIWSHSFGGSHLEMIESLRKIDDTYFHVGYSGSDDGHVGQNNGSMDAWIMGVNASGDSVFSLSFGGSSSDYAKDIIETRNGFRLITGYTSSGNGDFSGVSSCGTVDGFAYVVDSLGGVIHKERFGGSNDDRLSRVIPAFYKGYLFLGMASSSDGLLQVNHGSMDAWALRLDSNLNLVWSKAYGGVGNDHYVDGYASSDGGFILAGNTRSETFSKNTQAPYTDGTNCFLQKLNSLGEEIWYINLGGSEDEYLAGLTPLNDGNYLAYGYTPSDDKDIHDNQGGLDGYVIKFSENGDTLWTRCVGWNANDILHEVIEYKDNQFLGLLMTDDSVNVNSYGEIDLCLIAFDSVSTTLLGHYGGSGTDGNDLMTNTDFTSMYLDELSGELHIGSVSTSDDYDLDTNMGTIDTWIFSLDVSPVLMGAEWVSAKDFELFPNPSSGLINLRLKQYDGNPYLIEIYTETGTKVKEISCQQSTSQINLKGLTPGLYFISITTEKGKGVKRFLVF
ncbi:MAG: T9SS type A sorting domain-containing protein [Bacteroidota bacterium]